MTTLYDLAGQYLALSELADDPNMPADALTDTLDGIEGEIEIKAEGILQVSVGLNSDIAAIDSEIKRLQSRKQVIQNRDNRLKEYLRTNMLETGINKISCPLFQITLAKDRPIVVVDDETLIPEKFIKTTVTKAPIKAEILTALKAGEVVPGCCLGESVRSLMIK